MVVNRTRKMEDWNDSESMRGKHDIKMSILLSVCTIMLSLQVFPVDPDEDYNIT